MSHKFTTYRQKKQIICIFSTISPVAILTSYFLSAINTLYKIKVTLPFQKKHLPDGKPAREVNHNPIINN